MITAIKIITTVFLAIISGSTILTWVTDDRKTISDRFIYGFVLVTMILGITSAWI